MLNNIVFASLAFVFLLSTPARAESPAPLPNGAISQLEWVGCGISKKAYVTDLAAAFEQKTHIHINIKGGGATKDIGQVQKHRFPWA